MTTTLTYKAISDVGCVRKNNEDMAYAAGRLVRDCYVKGSTEGTCAFAVADGMGGYEGGDVASEIVCRSFNAFMSGLLFESDSQIINDIKDWACEANNLVLETAWLRPELSEMGTTFVGLIFAGKKMWLINIGDSRCYRIRGGILKQLSTDHSERNRTGNPDTPSNLIYNYIGNIPEDFFSDISEYVPIEGDTYLLCSDGLSDMISDDAIEENAGSVERLVELAKEAGGIDNITVVKVEL